MSFILDALKKSESDRQRQGGPALFEVKVAPPRHALPPWAVAIAVLLLANLGVVAWFLLRHTPAPAAGEAAAATRVPVPARAEAAPPAATAMNTPAAAAPAAAPAPRSVTTAPAPAPAPARAPPVDPPSRHRPGASGG